MTQFKINLGTYWFSPTASSGGSTVEAVLIVLGGGKIYRSGHDRVRNVPDQVVERKNVLVNLMTFDTLRS